MVIELVQVSFFISFHFFLLYSSQVSELFKILESFQKKKNSKALKLPTITTQNKIKKKVFILLLFY